MPQDEFLKLVDRYHILVFEGKRDDFDDNERDTFNYLVNWGYLTQEGDYDTEYFTLKELNDGTQS